jgi:hypothetical protein
MYIAHSGGGEFYMVFGELVAPAFAPGSDVPSELTIKPKVRLVVESGAMKRIADAIQENIESYLKNKELREGE